MGIVILSEALLMLMWQQPDYRGRQVDAFNDEKVIVQWKSEAEGLEDHVHIIVKE